MKVFVVFISRRYTRSIYLTFSISSVRLISIAAQKFISDVANDALQHCKTRTSNAPSSGGHGSAKNPKATKKYTLTMEDLAPALGDYGITARKAYYFV